MDSAIALGGGGLWRCPGVCWCGRAAGHPRVLRVVAIYQPVQNYFSTLTADPAPPETTSVPGTGSPTQQGLGLCKEKLEQCLARPRLLTAEGPACPHPATHRGASSAASAGHQADTSQVLSFPLYTIHLPVWIPVGWRGSQKHTRDCGEETPGGVSLTQPK